MHRLHSAIPTLLILSSLSLATPADAQRETAKLRWKKNDVTVEYGPVNVGKHGLESLPVGSDWRVGFNHASVLDLSVPIVAGDAVAAPGSYRIKLHRRTATELLFRVEGAGAVLAGKSPDAWFAGTMSELDKPTKKLELEWDKPAGKSATCESQLSLLFGESRFDIPVTALDATKVKGKTYTAEVFNWPAETLAARVEQKLATPIATVRPKRKPKKGEAEGYNLVVGPDSARLVGLMAAPTEFFGFADVQLPPPEQILTGTVTWTDAEQDEAVDHLRAEDFQADKKVLEISFAVGKKRGVARFDLEQKPEK